MILLTDPGLMRLCPYHTRLCSHPQQPCLVECVCNPSAGDWKLVDPRSSLGSWSSQLESISLRDSLPRKTRSEVIKKDTLNWLTGLCTGTREYVQNQIVHMVHQCILQTHICMLIYSCLCTEPHEDINTSTHTCSTHVHVYRLHEYINTSYRRIH